MGTPLLILLVAALALSNIAGWLWAHRRYKRGYLIGQLDAQDHFEQAVKQQLAEQDAERPRTYLYGGRPARWG
jgi:hypothetical protein